MRRSFILVLFALSLVLSAGNSIVQPSAGGGGGLSEYASYAALPSGASDGDQATATDTGATWRYSSVASEWLYPDMRPTSMIVDYRAAALPDASTPLWTASAAATYTATVSGGTLSLATTDNAGKVWYKYTNASKIVSTSDMAMMFRARITAQVGAEDDGFQFFFVLHPATRKAIMATLAYGSALSAINVVPCYASNGNGIDVGVTSPDNAAWAWYIVRYAKDIDKYSLAVVGGDTYYLTREGELMDHAAFPAGTVAFGTSEATSTVAAEITDILVFAY